MKPIKACIFDLDGVIVDTAKYHFLAWQRLAQELGITFTEHDNERLKGVSRVESLKIILEIGNKTIAEAEFESAMARKNGWFLDYIHQMTPEEVLPGVQKFLDELKSQNIKIALASSSKNAETILQQIGMLAYFEAIIDGNQVIETKPNPEIFLKAARAIDEKPENCIVFEDAIAGVEAAINGGFRVVGIGLPEVLGEADWVVRGFEGFGLANLQSILQ
ncbi:MAG: beta-phosphoglucomutase [Microscillaceae bacterium]|jgi:beta-phosphoglucomutase|nr:beta-phosphoglucomutase [Microscillaceae bacterium]